MLARLTALALILLVSLPLGLVAADGDTEEGAAADAPTEASAAEAPATSSPGPGDTIESEVDWLEEIIKGGNTAYVLLLLVVILVTVCVERLLNLRVKHIAPHQFVEEVEPLWHEGRFEEIHEVCEEQPSVLAHMTAYLVEHRQADPELLIPGAAEIGVRELRAHAQRAFTLAVIAGLAPLLGLLGTMIGMIESFNLVALYGDEGGASMLADSISKALITTALGLIIAIPALAIYHFFKFRVTNLGKLLDEELEVLINSWLLRPSGERVEQPAAEPSRAPTDAAPRPAPQAPRPAAAARPQAAAAAPEAGAAAPVQPGPHRRVRRS